MTETRQTVLKIATPEQMHNFGVQLGKLLRAQDLILLTGHLGAGKTTLTRGIGAGMGVRGPITSPTFVLARTHPSLNGGAALVHVDAYRLGDSAELEDLDINFSRSVVVAEWGAGLVDPEQVTLEIVITRPEGAAADQNTMLDAAEERSLTLTYQTARWHDTDFQSLVSR